MSEPAPAAAVILIRNNPELEVFWVRRSPRMAFQSGFHAFPGGKLEPSEDARACAVRELEEEVGVKVDPAALIEVGRWVTPVYAPRRFDTAFFLATCPSGQNAVLASEEHDMGEWIRPADALAKWMEGQILLAAPILHSLRRLSDGLDNIEARMKATPDAGGKPPRAIEIRPGVTLAPVRTPTLPPATHTNCYVIGGPEVIVIDPASPYEDEQKSLDEILENRAIREIWLTHLHRDHVGGANHLRARRGVKIAAHAITARALTGYVEVDRVFEDNERVELEGSPGWTLRVIHTPGHARGHVCIFEERHGSLITGDLMAGAGTVVIDPPEGQMAAYLQSLEKVKALPVTALFPAHGPVMANAKVRIQEYLDHRLLREQRILDAWNKGIRETGDIVKEVYKDVDPSLHDLAGRSVLAHLENLRDERRIDPS